MVSSTGVDTRAIAEKARRDLLQLLQGVRGKKNLVIEQSLAGPIGVFTKFSALQENGVEKVFFLENDNVDGSQKNVIFLARGEKASQVIAITEQIQRLQKQRSTEHEFSIFWVSRRTLVSHKILEEAGVLGDISVEELPLHFIPYEDDVLNLALDDAFGDLYLRKDPTCVFLAAQALMSIQHAYGLFPRIIGKGSNAKRLMELLLRLRSEALTSEPSNSIASQLGMMPSSLMESLIIIDREVDFSTPLLTQLTYEGLVDEIFGIKDNQAEINTSIIGQAAGTQPNQQQNVKRKIQLDSSDSLYAQLRDTNFATGSRLLSKFAKRLQSEYESRHTAKSTSELRAFVSKLPAYQTEQASLKTQIALAEEIEKQTLQSPTFSKVLEIQQNLIGGADGPSQYDAIDELISRAVPLSTILRLLCLVSSLNGGLKLKDFEYFKQQILQAYGYQHLLTLSSLEKTGLLVPRPSTGNPFQIIPGTSSSSSVTTSSSALQQQTNYPTIRKPLRLIVEDVDEQDPKDIAYTYSLYAPLSVRLVQCILQKPLISSFASSTPLPADAPTGSPATGWSPFEDLLRSVRGENFTRVQKAEDAAAAKAKHMLSGGGGGASGGTLAAGGNRKTVVVMFLGGITFTEIAALRFVGKQLEEEGGSSGGRKILICTTGIVGGREMMDAVMEKGGFDKQ